MGMVGKKLLSGEASDVSTTILLLEKDEECSSHIHAEDCFFYDTECFHINIT